MDDEYQNPENILQESALNETLENQISLEASEESSLVSPEPTEIPTEAAESSQIPAESVASPQDSVAIPIENQESVAADNPETPAVSADVSSLSTEESTESVDAGSPEEPALKPGEVADRDDYFTGEPPKLKYYDEAERQEEINKYKKFKKVDGETYRKVNVFLRKRTYITAREWALARLCADFKTPYGSEMTFIGEHLPELCPFMQEPYSPQAVNQARTSFKRKVRKSAATFLYGAMCGFFTPEELDDILFEANEVSKFFLEIEGTTLELDEEIDIEDKISKIMKGLGSSARSILKTRMADEEEDDDDVIVVPVEESARPSENKDESAEDESDSGSSKKEDDTAAQ
ncbi:MAG TPA: DUF5806 family protein [Methanocorpusculum sp.]|nr:DUF5806 family protein [Methanocorpusculum sp.]